MWLPASLLPSKHFNLQQVGGSTAPLYRSGVAPVTRTEGIASSSGEQLVDLWQHHVEAAGEHLSTSPPPPVYLHPAFSPIPRPPHDRFTSSSPPPNYLFTAFSSLPPPYYRSTPPSHHLLTPPLYL